MMIHKEVLRNKRQFVQFFKGCFFPADLRLQFHCKRRWSCWK